jgi:hydroxymethylglutaryl-CoA reductase (NADPH)
MPDYFNAIRDDKREIYLIFFEYLDPLSMKIFDSENDTAIWTNDLILDAINAIHTVHKTFLESDGNTELQSVNKFEVVSGLPFYQLACRVNKKDYEYWDLGHLFDDISRIMDTWTKVPPVKKSRETLVHNDFNTRNVGIRKNGTICIYDWELAVFNIPHRDIFEFLSFSMDINFEPHRLLQIIQSHYIQVIELNQADYNWKNHLDDFIISGYEFLISRVSFYLAGNTLLNYQFTKRVFVVANKIIECAKTLYDRH